MRTFAILSAAKTNKKRVFKRRFSPLLKPRKALPSAALVQQPKNSTPLSITSFTVSLTRL